MTEGKPNLRIQAKISLIVNTINNMPRWELEELETSYNTGRESFRIKKNLNLLQNCTSIATVKNSYSVRTIGYHRLLL